MPIYGHITAKIDRF